MNAAQEREADLILQRAKDNHGVFHYVGPVQAAIVAELVTLGACTIEPRATGHGGKLTLTAAGRS